MQNFTGITTLGGKENIISEESVDGSFFSRQLSKQKAAQESSVDYESTLKTATQLACFFNLTNTIIGSGILGLPYAFAASGWIVGTFLLVFSGASSAFALHTLSLCALKFKGPSSYYSIAVRALPRFTLVIDVAVAINCFGTATSYLVVIGDLMPPVMQQLGASGAALDRHLWVAIGFSLVAPLCCLQNLDSLRFTSSVSMLIVVFLTLLVILYSSGLSGLDACSAVGDGASCAGSTSYAIVNVHTCQVFSIFIFGFNCQQNTFAITNEMDTPSQRRVNTVIGGAVGTSFVVYLIFAACGYSTYGSLVESNILLNYPNTYLTSVARVFVSLLVTFCYPLNAHPARRSILTLLHHWDNYLFSKTDAPTHHLNPTATTTVTTTAITPNPTATSTANINIITAATISPMQQEEDRDNESDFKISTGDIEQYIKPNSVMRGETIKPTIEGMGHKGHELTREEQRIRYTYVTLLFLGLSLLIGMSVSNLGTILAVVGATGSTTVSYILPGFFYYCTFRDEGPTWKRYLSLGQGILGLIIIPVCLTFIFI